MAKVHEENIIITVSRLVKGNAAPKELITKEIISDLEGVVQQLVGDVAVVEINKASE